MKNRYLTKSFLKTLSKEQKQAVLIHDRIYRLYKKLKTDKKITKDDLRMKKALKLSYKKQKIK